MRIAKKLFSIIWYILFLIIISSLLIEVAVRIFIPEYVYIPHPRDLYRADADAGYVNSPDYRGLFEQKDYVTPVYINNLGMRTDSLAPLPEIDDYNILLIGDSFTFANQVPFEKTFTAKLEEKLEKFSNAHTIRVWNAGVNGYGTIHELLLMKKLCAKIKPQAIILQFYNNDVQDNYVYKSAGTASYRTVKNGYLYATTESGVTLSLPRPIRDFLNLNSRSYVYLKQKISLYLNRYRTQSELGIFKKAPPFFITEGWQTTNDILKEFSTLCREKGISFMIMYIPGLLQFSPGFLESFDVDTTEFDFTGPGHFLGDLCNKQQIPYLNLQTELLRIPDPASCYMQYQHDRHLNEKGHTFVAEMLSQFISEHQFMQNSLSQVKK